MFGHRETPVQCVIVGPAGGVVPYKQSHYTISNLLAVGIPIAAAFAIVIALRNAKTSGKEIDIDALISRFVSTRCENATTRNSSHSQAGSSAVSSCVKQDTDEDAQMKSFLLGKRVFEDIASDDNKFRVEKGTVLTEDMIRAAQVHDALVKLVMGVSIA